MTSQPAPEQRQNPYPHFAAMRRDKPIAYDERSGFWSVYRYADVRRVLSDYATFSSDRTRLPRPENPELQERMRISSSLIGIDPPRHRLMRDLVSRVFTARAVAQLEPRIAELTHELLDAVAPTGRMDLIADLAYPLPVTVIAELLGVPSTDRPMFKRWADGLFDSSEEPSTSSESPAVKDRLHVLDEMDDYFRRVVEQRRAAPRDDLISGLVFAEVEGQRLSEPEILAFCNLLLLAGHITTTNLLGNAIMCLLDHPDQLARLRAEPSLVPPAVEEVLRYDGPVQVLVRLVTRETEVAGQPLAVGDQLLTWVASANRDEAVFADPERFEIGRSPNPHLAFGFGIHFCLGAPLARLEGRVALAILVNHLQELHLTEPAPTELTRSGFLRGVSYLPLGFRARAA